MSIREEIIKQVDKEIQELAKRVVKEELREIWGEGPAAKCFQDQVKANNLIRGCHQYY